ncbi:hypothetical protein FP2506_10026 [Fulvimarina pelagi HTCC2506]|uniref:DUF559 domain-containing protein n=1 Tax=Fulvimarina pelagi HTCC2506 TaxID=314231 RepID=Q0G591_9HYPH|nr:DUF559 domain-containing protein [Fulvimarina pelagi]EAU43173.1 hypothetical protein FP2506_10026 [Fulvimarina pelagi HTCC2506]
MASLDRFRRNASRRLRSDSTDWERKLWAHLWRIPLKHGHFRRQAPIGKYIVDFACHTLKLVIEIDGAQHNQDANLQRDAERDRWLSSQGYRVVRFTNDDVKHQINAVLDTIYAVVEERRLFKGDR